MLFDILHNVEYLIQWGRLELAICAYSA